MPSEHVPPGEKRSSDESPTYFQNVVFCVPLPLIADNVASQTFFESVSYKMF